MAGEGSVYRSGEWFVAQISIGPRGHRRYVRRKRRRKSEAVAALAELQADKRAGVTRTRATTGDFLAAWVADVRNLRPSTRHGYQVAVELHLIPELGGIRLDELAPLDVEHALARLSERMSPKHLRNVHAVLRRALNDAVRKGMVTRNVAGREFVDAPRVPDEEPAAFTSAEVARLLLAARGDRLEAPLRVAIGTGLRQGELLGLAWEDLDLAGRRIHVRRELTRVDGRYVRAELKTGSRSRRVLPLAPELVDVLERHEAAIREEGLVPIATGPVFVSPAGAPLNGSWMTHRLYQLEERAGIRRLPWKNLRTTFASRLFEAGVSDRVIADWLGHTRTKTTHGHYIDTADASQERALAAVGAMVR